MWVFSLITVILTTVVKIIAPHHAVRDHYRCVHTSPLPLLEPVQSYLQIKCTKRILKEKGKLNVSSYLISQFQNKSRNVFIMIQCLSIKD